MKDSDDLRQYLQRPPTVQARIRRLDPNFPLPRYHSPGAAAFDFHITQAARVFFGFPQRLPTGLVIQVPEGYVLRIEPRSSLSAKGLFVVSGVVDADFCGPNDEIHIQVASICNDPVDLPAGTRIAQGFFHRVFQADWEEVAEMTGPDRGGFGTTGE